MPQISVIVPVYRVEPYLRRCVDSVLRQRFSDFELILVDDGSPDGCPAICDAYASADDRVMVIHQPNGGLSAARNAGLDWVFAHSDSQWITFIDSDDWVHPQYLELLFSAVMEQDVHVGICGYIQTGGETPEPFPEIPPAALWNTEDFYTERTTNATIACAKLYRKSCFQTMRYPVGKLHEDEYTTYQILFDRKTLAVIDAPLYFYYHNPGSITNTPWTPRRMEVLEAFDAQLAYFAHHHHPAALTRRVRSYLWMLCSQYYGACSANCHYTAEIQFLKKKMRYILRHYRQHIHHTWSEYAAVLEIVNPLQYRIRKWTSRR